MKSGTFKWTREPEAFKNDNGKIEMTWVSKVTP